MTIRLLSIGVLSLILLSSVPTAQAPTFSKTFSLTGLMQTAVVASFQGNLFACRGGVTLSDIQVEMSLTRSQFQGWIGTAIVDIPPASATNRLFDLLSCHGSVTTFSGLTRVSVPVQENVEGTQVGGGLPILDGRHRGTGQLISGATHIRDGQVAVQCFWTGSGCSELRVHVSDRKQPQPLEEVYDIQARLVVETLPDLAVKRVRPVQVIYDVDLIKGKSTAFEVTLGVTSSAQIPAGTSIVLELQFDGRTVEWSIPKTMLVEGDNIVFINPTPRVRPTTVGKNIPVVVKVDPLNAIAETNEQNNQPSSPVTTNVVETPPLNLLYVPVRSNGLFPQPTTMSAYIEGSKEYLEALYPVAVINTSQVSTPIQSLGIFDYLNLSWLAFRAGADGAVGVGTLGYLGASGAAFASFPGIRVESNSPEAVAHEFLHVYTGADDEYISTNTLINTSPATGFWVDGSSAGLPITNRFCVLGFGDDKRLAQSDLWIDSVHFDALLNSFRKGPDPEVLFVSALVFQSGAVELGPFAISQTGTATVSSVAGDLALRVLDRDGRVISEVVQNLFFEEFVDPAGRRTSPVVPVAAALEFPIDAELVEIRRDGRLVRSVRPASKLLHDAIDAIPEDAFTRPAAEIQGAWHNQVDALEKILAVGNKNGAVNLLKALKSDMSRSLLDAYAVESPLQLTKPEVLAVVDEAIRRADRQ